ncbi:MAG TPA: hypothetical protein VJH70_00190 [Candidatus Paceibacterota bacterium]
MSNKKLSDFWIGALSSLTLIGLGIGTMYVIGDRSLKKNEKITAIASDIETVDGEVIIPAQWDSLGIDLVKNGVIDLQSFEALYEARGGLPADMEVLLTRSDIKEIRMNENNSDILLNILWALGLGNENRILTQGPMMDARYGGAGGFASTGGWTLARGDAMNHYARHPLIALTSEQQSLVEKMSRSIHRPCCGNATHFPDCNHGMAMLGLLELLAAQGMSEQEMYKVAYQVQKFWFPDNYLTIEKYFQQEGMPLVPEKVLSSAYSSSAGYQKVVQLLSTPPVRPQGGSCGV